MNKQKIIRLVNLLNWNLPECLKKEAYDELLTMVDESNCDLLIQIELPQTLYNAILLIEEIGYPKNRKALPSLIKLFQDMSSPGIIKSIEILKNIDVKVVIPLIESAIKEAYAENNLIWIQGIYSFLEEAEIGKNNFDNMETYHLLERMGRSNST